MEFLAEFLFELLGEVFLGNGVEAASDHHLPKWLRVLILAVTALVYAAVFSIILAVGIGALSHTPLMSALMFTLDAVLILIGFRQVRGILRTRPRK